MTFVNVPLPHLQEVAGRFILSEAPVDISPLGSGLINDTWICSPRTPTGEGRSVLQRLNGTVFPRPDLVMENIAAVTGHIIARLRREGVDEPGRRTLALMSARDGRSFHVDVSGAFWRMFRFIEEGEVFDAIQGAGHAYEVGSALGRFQALLSDLPPGLLHDTLPGFHHTGNYLQELREAARTDAAGRKASVDRELSFIEERATLAGELVEAMANRRVPVRVVHNDPKVNNVMIQRESGKALCMLDLDTVKPGIVLFDFGDCVRSAANRSGEDAADLESVCFDRVCYEAVRAGYLDQAGGILTQTEIGLLPRSVRIITLELGIRFLTDYLRGDSYFRTRYPGQNRHRAQVQLRLLERMEAAGL